MRTLTISALPAIIVIALLSTGAAAQTFTDEARALAAKATAAHEREAWAYAPVAEPGAAGDYRAEAHQRERVLQWQASSAPSIEGVAGFSIVPVRN